MSLWHLYKYVFWVLLNAVFVFSSTLDRAYPTGGLSGVRPYVRTYVHPFVRPYVRP